MQSGSPIVRRVSAFTAAALAFLFVSHVVALYAARYRGLHFDEAQYLHVGWLMAHGRALYKDFAEDHAPFLFVILKWLLPAGPSIDLLSYVARARGVAAAFGVMALAAVALLTYRATRTLFAPFITTAILLGSFWVWREGLADVRNDPPALFLFWLGVLFLVGRWGTEQRRFALAGIGIGLAVAAALWNPKMPFECAVLGALYLWRLGQAFRASPRMVATAVVPAVTIVAATVDVIASAVSLRDYVFFTFQYNRILLDYHASARRMTTYFWEGTAFTYCDPAFKGWWPFLTFVAAAVILFGRRIRAYVHGLDLHAYAVVFALVIAAGLDIRFVLFYPDLWPQYYLMWDFAIAALYGMTAATVLRSTSNIRVEAAVQIVAVLVAIVIVLQSLPTSPGSSSWRVISYLRQRLRPQETVWLSPEQHPIAVDDASYYWFAFGDLMPASLRYVAAHPRSPLPFASEENLPICRAERGLEPHLRYVSGDTLGALPVTAQCLQRMIAAGRAVRIPTRSIWDLRPPPPGH